MGELVELQPIYDSRKSFYKKAHTYITSRGSKVLRSYTTDVAVITEEGTIVLQGLYSDTTMRHIREFLKQNVEAKFWTKDELESFIIEERVHVSNL